MFTADYLYTLFEYVMDSRFLFLKSMYSDYA